MCVCLVTQCQDMASCACQDISGDDQMKVKGYLKQMTSHKFVLHCHIMQCHSQQSEATLRLHKHASPQRETIQEQTLPTFSGK